MVRPFCCHEKRISSLFKSPAFNNTTVWIKMFIKLGGFHVYAGLRVNHRHNNGNLALIENRWRHCWNHLMDLLVNVSWPTAVLLIFKPLKPLIDWRGSQFCLFICHNSAKQLGLTKPQKAWNIYSNLHVSSQTKLPLHCYVSSRESHYIKIKEEFRFNHGNRNLFM